MTGAAVLTPYDPFTSCVEGREHVSCHDIGVVITWPDACSVVLKLHRLVAEVNSRAVSH